MSVADRLGTSSSFSERRSRSARGRAKAVTQGDVPAYELVRLRLDEVSPTPLNPRRNFGTDEDKTRFGEELRQAQLAACVAVTRSAYLALWPDHEVRIGAAGHVLVNGERRFHSAVHVGLDALDFVVRDDLASSREGFINHLLKENLEREDFDVIERARGVQELVNVCTETSERGARTRAAEQLGRDRSWVTNQLVLLELPTEIQVMLSAGDLAERDGRALARHLKDNPELSGGALLEHLEATKSAEARAKAEERSQLQALRQATSSGLLSADNKPDELEATAEVAEQGEQQVTTDEPALLSADNKAISKPSMVRPPAQRQGESEEASAAVKPPVAPSEETEEGHPEEFGHDQQPKRLPYDDAFYVVNHLHLKMKPEVFAEGARLWLRIMQEQHPDAYRSLLADLAEEEQEPA